MKPIIWEKWHEKGRPSTLKTRLWNSLKKKWERKVKDGRYIWSIDRQLVSEEDTFLWQSRGDLKGETESEII